MGRGIGQRGHRKAVTRLRGAGANHSDWSRGQGLWQGGG